MIEFQLNGRRTIATSPEVTPLIDVLREELGDTSPKPGCREGRCGSCSVLLDGEPVVSCLVPLARVAGSQVVTARGLCHGDTLDPVQEAFARSGAIQCGICTPGMLVAVRALLDESPAATAEQVKAGLVNNLCRCTGYRKILDAVAGLTTAEVLTDNE